MECPSYKPRRFFNLVFFISTKVGKKKPLLGKNVRNFWTWSNAFSPLFLLYRVGKKIGKKVWNCEPFRRRSQKNEIRRPEIVSRVPGRHEKDEFAFGSLLVRFFPFWISYSYLVLLSTCQRKKIFSHPFSSPFFSYLLFISLMSKYTIFVNLSLKENVFSTST